MRHRTSPTRARATAARLERGSLIEPAIAGTLALFIAWLLATL